MQHVFPSWLRCGECKAHDGGPANAVKRANIAQICPNLGRIRPTLGDQHRSIWPGIDHLWADHRFGASSAWQASATFGPESDGCVRIRPSLAQRWPLVAPSRASTKHSPPTRWPGIEHPRANPSKPGPKPARPAPPDTAERKTSWNVAGRVWATTADLGPRLTKVSSCIPSICAQASLRNVCWPMLHTKEALSPPPNLTG